MTEPTPAHAEALQEHMVELTRAFGWHRPDSTPCGKPVPIAEAHALLEVGRSPGITQRDLGTALKLCKSTVSRVVSNLEKRAWIARHRSESDGRAVEITLTDEGNRASDDLASARQAKMTGILERIPETERAEVLRALRTLIEAIHENDS